MTEAQAKTELDALRRRFVEAAGNFTQSLGFGRAIGQVFVHAFFTRAPITLDDLTHDLGISKGSASMIVRQLEQWGALRRVWVKGARKIYYEASDQIGRIVRKALLDMVGRRMEAGDQLLEQADASLSGRQLSNGAPEEDWRFMRQRVERLKLFRDRTRRLWESSIIKMLLK